MTSTESKDPVVKSVAPTNNSEDVEGKIGCTARTGSSEAYGCPGLRSAWAWWLGVGHWGIHVASVVEKRKMEVEKIHRQEEIRKCTRPLSELVEDRQKETREN